MTNATTTTTDTATQLPTMGGPEFCAFLQSWAAGKEYRYGEAPIVRLDAAASRIGDPIARLQAYAYIAANIDELAVTTDTMSQDDIRALLLAALKPKAATEPAYTSSLITRFNDDAPALWVGCLAAYNAGTLHGAWLNVTSNEAEVMEAVQEILAASPVVGAEEWDIMDAQLLPGDAGRTVSAACAYVALLDEIEDNLGGCAAEILAAWVDWQGELPESADQLVDAYLGQFDSVQDYAEQYADDTGLLAAVPEELRGYFNFAAFARDLELGGDVYHGQHGHTFNGHA